MNERVYVLAVEALVFGALCTVVLAQRLDVFHWPADRCPRTARNNANRRAGRPGGAAAGLRAPRNWFRIGRR